MKVAILSRSGPCFPNVISQGLEGMLDEINVESRIFYEGIPMLMRMLPLSKKQKRWHNSLQFRIRNKLANYLKDKKLLRELNSYDSIIVSECYPNAFWKNYFAIEELRKNYRGKLISYTESPLDSAPENRKSQMDDGDYDESVYDYNLFVTDTMEVKKELTAKQAMIGVNISFRSNLELNKKREFTAVLDFPKGGFEKYRTEQINVLKKLGIKTISLEGKYPIEEISKIYAEASVFFLSFPETFGLPIAECLASGTYVFTPDSSWPMSWRLDENPLSGGPGILPSCFRIYNGGLDLENKLKELENTYHFENTPAEVFNTYIEHYRRFYYGDPWALNEILSKTDIGSFNN